MSTYIGEMIAINSLPNCSYKAVSHIHRFHFDAHSYQKQWDIGTLGVVFFSVYVWHLWMNCTRESTNNKSNIVKQKASREQKLENFKKEQKRWLKKYMKNRKKQNCTQNSRYRMSKFLK